MEEVLDKTEHYFSNNFNVFQPSPLIPGQSLDGNRDFRALGHSPPHDAGLLHQGLDVTGAGLSSGLEMVNMYSSLTSSLAPSLTSSLTSSLTLRWMVQVAVQALVLSAA